MRRIHSSLLRLMMSLCVVVGVAGCDMKDIEKAEYYLRFGQSEDQILKATTAAQRQQVVESIYGDDAIYISPDQRDAMFASGRSFVWNLLGGVRVVGDGASFFTTDKIASGINDEVAHGSLPTWMANYADQTQVAMQSWDTIRNLNVNEHKVDVDARLAAIKARIGDRAYGLLLKDEKRLYNYVWNPDQFNRLMTDDEWAASEIASLTGTTDASAIDPIRQNLGPAFGAVTDRTGSAD